MEEYHFQKNILSYGKKRSWNTEKNMNRETRLLICCLFHSLHALKSEHDVVLGMRTTSCSPQLGRLNGI
jgi:hypothetical protein